MKFIILQIILILLNAFFAATEIAVVSLNEVKVKARADDGDRKAKKMLKIAESVSILLFFKNTNPILHILNIILSFLYLR